MQKNQSQKEQTTLAEQIHLYASDQEISIRKSLLSKSFQQILQEKVQSDDQILQIYSSINQRIENYKNSSRKQVNGSEQMNKYYKLKAKLFYQFYGQKNRQVQVNDRVEMFEISNLYELFVDIYRIRDQIKLSIYKLFGPAKRIIKINGYMLLFKVESLIKQIINAAFPFRLYMIKENKICLNSFEAISLAEFKSKIEDQEREIKKFKFEELLPLKNSLLELSDEIESIQMQIKKDEKALGNIDLRQTLLVQNQINIVHKSIQMNNLEYLKLKHQLCLFQSSYIHRPIENSLNFINIFIEKQPVHHINKEKIEGFATLYLQHQQNFDYYFKYLKRLIQSFSLIQSKQTKEYNKTSQSIISLIQNWINIVQHNPNSLLIYENYISILKIHCQINSKYIEKRQDIVSAILENYIFKLINFYINQHWIVMNRIAAFDQQFTYCLLTTNKIIQTILEFEDKFIALIDQFAPLIETFIDISQIKLKNQDKQNFIKNIIEKVYYLSQKGQGYLIKQQKQEQTPKKDVEFNIQIILSIDHQSINQVKPYLKEIQLTLVLVKILKRNNIKRNINKMQKEQFQHLKKCAAYFSKQREGCAIYELKSKILLFITLFKMGYHNPTLKQQERLVNLRNRIINLYNKLYSHNTGNMMLSRINSVSIRRSYSQQSYYIYDPLLTSVNSRQSENSQIKESIQASDQLVQKINKFIMLNFIKTQNNSKLYLMNLLNILQHELFILEKDISQQNQKLLSCDYMEYLKVCMDLDQDMINPNIQIILDIERLFYLQEYQKAWNILTKEKQDNAEFNIFLQQVESSSTTSNQILKFLRLYNIFEKMNHIFFSDSDKQKNISQLLQMINANTLFQIPRKPIQIIYNIRAKENRLLQLQQFYLSKLKDKDSVELDYEQIESFITKQSKSEIKVYRLQKINKTILKIQIGQALSNLFQQINEELKKYFLFNQIGIYKINDIKVGKTVLIELQSNPFNIKGEEKNLFKSKILSFQQNFQEKFTRKVLQFIVQTLHIFYQQNINCIQPEQINLTLDPLSFCINPFYGLILKFIRKNPQKKKKNPLLIQGKNRKIIQQIIKPFLNSFSSVFRQHYYYFIESLSKDKKKIDFNINKLLQLPLFMTFQQKQVFLVYFDNKMSQMCDSFHQQLRKLRKQKKYNEVQKLRLAKMKDPIYKNYCYHFVVGGVLQAEMNKLKICSEKQNSRLDWISQHQHLKISYDLPKKQNSSDIKEYAYSLNYFLKYLRGALAHKIENNYKIIQNFSEEFPKIFDFLHQKKMYLQMKFEDVMNMKNEWMRQYFNLNEKLLLEKLKQIFAQNFYKGYMNYDVLQAIQILKQSNKKYAQIVKQKFKKAYKCDKCDQLINLAKKYSHLLDFLLGVQANMVKKNHFLSVQHNFKDCFLSQHLKSHRALQVFGSKKAEPRYYLVLNWWFFLQTELPCLIGSFNKIRYILQEDNDK